jgi:hypothetical protein
MSVDIVEEVAPLQGLVLLESHGFCYQQGAHSS